MANATTSLSPEYEFINRTPFIAYIRAQDKSDMNDQRGLLKDYADIDETYVERTYFDFITAKRESLTEMLRSLECEKKIRILTVSIDQIGGDSTVLWKLAHLIKRGIVENITTLERTYWIEDLLHVDHPRFTWEEDAKMLRDCVYTGIHPLDVPPGGDPKKILDQRLASAKSVASLPESSSVCIPLNPFDVPPNKLPA